MAEKSEIIEDENGTYLEEVRQIIDDKNLWTIEITERKDPETKELYSQSLNDFKVIDNKKEEEKAKERIVEYERVQNAENNSQDIIVNRRLWEPEQWCKNAAEVVKKGLETDGSFVVPEKMTINRTEFLEKYKKQYEADIQYAEKHKQQENQQGQEEKPQAEPVVDETVKNQIRTESGTVNAVKSVMVQNDAIPPVVTARYLTNVDVENSGMTDEQIKGLYGQTWTPEMQEKILRVEETTINRDKTIETTNDTKAVDGKKKNANAADVQAYWTQDRLDALYAAQEKMAKLEEAKKNIQPVSVGKALLKSDEENRKAIINKQVGLKLKLEPTVTVVPHIKRNGKPSKKNSDIMLTDAEGNSFRLTKKMMRKAIGHGNETASLNDRVEFAWNNYMKLAQEGKLQPETVASFFKNADKKPIMPAKEQTTQTDMTAQLIAAKAGKGYGLA